MFQIITLQIYKCESNVNSIIINNREKPGGNFKVTLKVCKEKYWLLTYNFVANFKRRVLHTYHKVPHFTLQLEISLIDSVVSNAS